jgi:Zn-dependent protease/CBS domain-containing protein
MRFRWTWKICRIAGITISVHPSWLVIYALFAWTATIAARLFSPELNRTSTLLLGLVASLMLFASVVAHEFAHALVARRLGIPIGGITLFLFGGVATITREPKRPADEFKMAIAGPALSVVLAAVFYGLAVVADALHWLWGSTCCFFLAFANALVAAFNLLPAFPSDGGRVLRSVLWMLQPSQARATVWASAVSVVVAAGLIIAGIFFVFDFHVARGWWWVLIGAFLAQAALLSGKTARVDLALERMRVRDCMLKTLVPVPAQTSVAVFIGEVAGKPQTAYPVVDQGKLVGFADLRQTAGIPVPLWHDTPVSAVMTPITHTIALTGAESARDVLNKLAERKVGELPVYDAGELVGIVTQDSIFRALHTPKAVA